MQNYVYSVASSELNKERGALTHADLHVPSVTVRVRVRPATDSVLTTRLLVNRVPTLSI